MHIIPRPENFHINGSTFRLFPDNRTLDPQDIPFRHFIHSLHSADLANPIGSNALLEVYAGLLARTRDTLGIPADDSESACPHNVLLVKEWIVVIPRRSNDFEGVTANAAGMMGSVWLMNEAQLDRWRALGPTKVLSQLGVPAKDGKEI